MRRHFCPSCHQKRVVEFGEWLCTQVLKKVPHRQWVFSIPKRLRIYFLYDRRLLAKLSRCAWKVLCAYFKQATDSKNAVPGAVIAVHRFGDFQQFNPHLHVIVSDGCFADSGIFRICPRLEGEALEDLFRYEVCKMLKSEGKITDVIIDNMLGWHHSGFNVYCGNPILPGNQKALEDLSRYIIRACFSQERITYTPGKYGLSDRGQVIYRSKDGRESKTFSALDWLAQLVTHIPNRYEHAVFA